MLLTLAIVLSGGSFSTLTPKSFAADPDWYTQWSYTLNDDDKVIELTDYIGTESEVEVPATATIDGTEYKTLYNAKTVDADYNARTASKLVNGAVEKLSFEEGVLAPEDSSWMFCYSGMKNIDASNLDTSNTTNMAIMFYNCSNLTSITVNGMDTSKVTDMRYMFGNLIESKLESLDVSGLDTSRVTNMNHMFANMTSLKSLKLGALKTDNVTDMSYMFYNCRSLEELDVTGFNTTKVGNMDWMFAYMPSLKYLDVSGMSTESIKVVTTVEEGEHYAQAHMFFDFGGKLYEGDVEGGGLFDKNVRKGEEYAYPGYCYQGNFGITGPNGLERVYCLSQYRHYPTGQYFKVTDWEDYIGGRYQRDDVIYDSKTVPETSLTEDDMAKIAAAIYYKDEAGVDREQVQYAIWQVSNPEAGLDPKPYYTNWVEPNWQKLKGRFEMHIYIPESESNDVQNLLGVTFFSEEEEKPEIEKYINQAVHKDIDVDEIFTYDIMAYVTKDADKVVIKDQLVDDLEFAVKDLSDVKIAAFEKDNHKVTNDISGNKVNSDATVAGAGKDIPIKDAVSVTKSAGGLLTVTDVTSSPVGEEAIVNPPRLWEGRFCHPIPSVIHGEAQEEPAG